MRNRDTTLLGAIIIAISKNCHRATARVAKWQ